MGATADHGEEHPLAEIERELSATDPELAAALSTMSLSPRPLRSTRPWTALVVLGLVLLLVGWFVGIAAVALLGAGSALVGAAVVRRSTSRPTCRPEEAAMGDGAVVVGVDGTEASARAALWAAGEAVAFGRPLVLVHGLRWPVYAQAYLNLQVDCGAEESARRWAQDVLDELAGRCRAVGAAEVRTEVTTVAPADAVIRGADRAAFIVVGHSDRAGVARLLLGSTAIRLTRSCPWPVVVVRDEAVVPERGSEGPVVVGVDGSPVSGVAVRFAFDFAARHGAEVLVVHAADRVAAGVEVDAGVEPGAGEGVAAAELAECVRRYPDVRHAVHVGTGAPAEVLIAAGDSARLLVVGSHGKGALSRALLGSVSQEVVNHASCPVAVLPPETADPRR